MPPAFNLSQDQTLQFILLRPPKAAYPCSTGYLHLRRYSVAYAWSLSARRSTHTSYLNELLKNYFTASFQRDRPFYRPRGLCQPPAPDQPADPSAPENRDQSPGPRSLSIPAHTASGPSTAEGSRRLGDCRRIMYRIAKDFRLPSRGADRSLAGLCDCRRDAQGGRKDERDGAWFDRNRLSSSLRWGEAAMAARRVRSPRQASPPPPK